MSRSHGYGSETRFIGTGTSFRIRITMGTGMGKAKGTTSLVETFEKLGYRFVHEGRLRRISY